MKQTNIAPLRATENETSQNHISVQKHGQPTGWRKVDANWAITEKLAQAGERAGVPKTKAFAAAKRVGAHIGLKPSDVMLLDTLGAFTQPQDWDERRRPIVWASNAYLMDQTGFSLSALKRHIRRLAKVGVIAFKDSPNGKRWGRRNGDGHIVEAYGFDLSPLAARAQEFTELYDCVQEERALCQRLRRQITVSRRTIRAQIDAAFEGTLTGTWTLYQERYDNLIAQLPRSKAASETLEQILANFTDLQACIEQAYLDSACADHAVENTRETREHYTPNTQKMDPKEINSGPHILTTNQLNMVTSNHLEHGKQKTVVRKTHIIVPIERQETDRSRNQPEADPNLALDVKTIMQACPEFAYWVRNTAGPIREWSELFRVACNLKHFIGITDKAWRVALEAMGQHIAAAALALVFDKHAKNEVSSASGYLLGMAKKARAGELYLARSLYGRLSAHQEA